MTRMMDKMIALGVCVLLSGCSPYTGKGKATEQTLATSAGGDDQQGQLVCRHERITGSNRKQKVCRYERDNRKLREAAQHTLRRPPGPAAGGGLE